MDSRKNPQSPTEDFIHPDDIEYPKIIEAPSSRFSSFAKTLKRFLHLENHKPTNAEPLLQSKAKRPANLTIDTSHAKEKKADRELDSIHDYSPPTYKKTEPEVLSGIRPGTPFVNTFATTPTIEPNSAPLESKPYSPIPSVNLPEYHSPSYPSPLSLNAEEIELKSETKIMDTKATAKNMLKNFTLGGLLGSACGTLLIFSATGGVSAPPVLTACCLCGTISCCCAKKKEKVEIVEAPASARMQ